MTKKPENDVGEKTFFPYIMSLFILTVLFAFQSYRFCFVFADEKPVEICPSYFFEVMGDVPHPGLYCYGYCPTMNELLKDGGLKADVNVLITQNPRSMFSNGSSLRVQENRKKVRVTCVPLEGKKKILLGIPIELNNATVDDLASLPGIGPRTAGDIVLLRKTRGRFTTIEEMKDVRGIGEKRFEKIKKYLTVTTRAVL